MTSSLKTAKISAVFLDRDGVINQKATEHDYIKRCEDFHLLPGAAKAIQLLNQHCYKVIIVTNQRGIARGMMTEDTLSHIHEKMNQDLKLQNAFIDRIYYCPHDVTANCTCRKPRIGMFLQAALEFDIGKETSFMVGDSLSDIESGINFGIKPILIGSAIEGVLTADDLLAAVSTIIIK